MVGLDQQKTRKCRKSLEFKIQGESLMDNIRLELTKDEKGCCLIFANQCGDECSIQLSYESVEHLVAAIDEFASDAVDGDMKIVDFDVLDSEEQEE